MKTSEVLRGAKALISSPRNWIRGDMASKLDGGIVEVNHPDAACFCAQGAIIRASGDESSCTFLHAEATLEEALVEAGFVDAFDDDGDQVDASIPEWNDSAFTTHSQVMRAFDKAIELAEADEISSPC